MNIMGDPTRVVNKRSLSEELRILSQLCQIQSKSVDWTIIDVKDYKASDDIDVHVQIEAMMEEIDCMEEVEMEDVPEEPVVDIDSCDKMNPLVVVEYIDDLYKFYRKAENHHCKEETLAGWSVSHASCTQV